MTEEKKKEMNRIKVNRHRKYVMAAEATVRQWAYWERHFNEPTPHPRPPRAHEEGHDGDMAPVTTRGKHDPQRLDPRYEGYLAVEAFVAHGEGWQCHRRFALNNAKKKYEIVLGNLKADQVRKEWYRWFLLGLARAIRDGDEVLRSAA